MIGTYLGGNGNWSYFDHIYIYEPLPLKGTIIYKNTLKWNIPLKGKIDYEKHTFKRNKTCQKAYPWVLSIGIIQYIGSDLSPLGTYWWMQFSLSTDGRTNFVLSFHGKAPISMSIISHKGWCLMKKIIKGI